MRSEVQIFPDPPILRCSSLKTCSFIGNKLRSSSPRSAQNTLSFQRRVDTGSPRCSERAFCIQPLKRRLTQNVLQLTRRMQANEGVYVMVNDRRERRMQRSQIQNRQVKGAIAQLGEHLLCKQGVGGSIPPGSTKPGTGGS